jgi:Tfp pilus assembly protein PilP
MRKAAVLLLFITIAAVAPLLAQQETTAPPPTGPVPALTVQTGFTYSPDGRRDPFKDLLSGRDLPKPGIEGNQLLIDDIVLFGIVKSKNVYTALVGTTQGFPTFARVGDRFADGYILSINDTQVVLRKTHERGIPLIRPRDVIKEITEEL